MQDLADCRYFITHPKHEAICTCQYYMFSYPKYEVQYIFIAYPIYFNLVFTFLLGKLITCGQLLVKPVVFTGFSFFNYKIYNTGATISTTGQVDYIYIFLLFFFQKL